VDLRRSSQATGWTSAISRRINTVDRTRFPSFDAQLRDAMFQEPIRFIEDVIQNDRSVLDFIYAKHTFVNPSLAKHYGMPR
jgi:hypothetical protein